ncbi:MAG: CvpA family protein [Acidobacteria bacterium]|nr:CvpA family protein [Acidobacteriota bacterium]
MNWLDIVLIAIFALSMGLGAMKGFVRIAIGLSATVFGILCGFWFYSSMGGVVKPYLKSDAVANVAGFVIIWVLFVLAGAVIGKLSAYFFKKAGLGWLDRLLGAVFGFVRATLAAMAIILVLVAFKPGGTNQSVSESRVAPYVIDAARVLAWLTPRELKEDFERNYEAVKSIWRKTVGAAV